MYTKILTGEDAKAKRMEAYKLIRTAVGGTLGANSRSTIFVKGGAAKAVNDGVDILKRTIPEDPHTTLVFNMLRDGSEATNNAVEDGTTSTALFAANLAEIAEDTKNPLKLQKELKEAVNLAVELIDANSIKITNDDELFNLAKISSDDEEVAKIVVEAVKESGDTGKIVVEETDGSGLSKEIVPGYEIDKGYAQPFYVNYMKKLECHLDNVPVLVTDRYLVTPNDLMPFVDQVIGAGIDRLLIIARKIESGALKSIYDNRKNGLIQIVSVEHEFSREQLEDIAAYVGATAVTADKTVKQITAAHLGIAKKIVLSAKKSHIMAEALPEEKQKVLSERIESLKDSKESEHRDRLARLTGKIISIKVGTPTTTERHYGKMKVDDALGTVKWGLKEGYVPGGGTTMLSVLRTVDSKLKTDGSRMLVLVAVQHIRQIINNCGESIESLFDDTFGWNKGLDAETGEMVDNLIGRGIIDATAVVKNVILNGVSAALPVIRSSNIMAIVNDKSDSGDEQN